jgi:hypothetical protein
VLRSLRLPNEDRQFQYQQNPSSLDELGWRDSAPVITRLDLPNDDGDWQCRANVRSTSVNWRASNCETLLGVCSSALLLVEGDCAYDDQPLY